MYMNEPSDDTSAHPFGHLSQTEENRSKLFSPSPVQTVDVRTIQMFFFKPLNFLVISYTAIIIGTEGILHRDGEGFLRSRY